MYFEYFVFNQFDSIQLKSGENFNQYFCSHENIPVVNIGKVGPNFQFGLSETFSGTYRIAA